MWVMPNTFVWDCFVAWLSSRPILLVDLSHGRAFSWHRKNSRYVPGKRAGFSCGYPTCLHLLQMCQNHRVQVPSLVLNYIANASEIECEFVCSAGWYISAWSFLCSSSVAQFLRVLASAFARMLDACSLTSLAPIVACANQLHKNQALHDANHGSAQNEAHLLRSFSFLGHTHIVFYSLRALKTSVELGVFPRLPWSEYFSGEDQLLF